MASITLYLYIRFIKFHFKSTSTMSKFRIRGATYIDRQVYNLMRNRFCRICYDFLNNIGPEEMKIYKSYKDVYFTVKIKDKSLKKTVQINLKWILYIT